MFALKSHRLGSQKKKVGLERINKEAEGEDADEVIKARFQEMGPRITIKLRWVRKGALGETGEERSKREKEEGVEDGQGDVAIEEVGGMGEDAQDIDDAEEERQAAAAIGLDTTNTAGQPNFSTPALSETSTTSSTTLTSPPPPSLPTKKRKRKPSSHPLLRPPRTGSPEADAYVESESVPLPPRDGKKKGEQSLLSTVGRSWHAGKGEGGVREAKKRREWGWEVCSFFLLPVLFSH